MLVSPQDYLSLTDELASLRSRVTTLEAENATLSDTLIERIEAINVLTQRLAVEQSKTKLLQQEIIRHIDQASANVEQAVSAATQQQMGFFQSELQKIKNDANVQKIRQLEKKMTENRFNNHEMVDFYQKIQTLYMVINNTKAVPSMPDLYKWATLRKHDELTISATNNLAVSQKSIMGGSKISITKNYQGPSMNASKVMGASKINQFNMSSSKLGKSKISPSNITDQLGQLRNERRLSRARNEVAPSKFQLGKENRSVEGKPPLGAKNKDKKGSKKNSKDVEILETESVTQAINVDSLSFENASDKLIPSLDNKQSMIHVII